MQSKSLVPGRVWVDRDLLEVKSRSRSVRILYIPFFKRDVRVIPVKYKMTNGASGTFWLAPKINYLVVKRVQVNAGSIAEGRINSGDVVISSLVSYKLNGDCLVK